MHSARIAFTATHEVLAMKILPAISLALLIATSPALAQTSTAQPRPKPPTIKELQNQNEILQQMLNVYRSRAMRAEDELLQESIRQQIAAQGAADEAKKDEK